MFWEVRVGEHNQKLTETSERTYSVARVFHYPWYRGYDNDLALMKLTSPIEVNDYVSPICLPEDSAVDFAEKQCVATGWGKVDYNKRGSDVLQKVQIEVYDNSECHRAYFPKFKIGIRQWHLCAGTKIGGKGTCHVSLMMLILTLILSLTPSTRTLILRLLICHLILTLNLFFFMYMLMGLILF